MYGNDLRVWKISGQNHFLGEKNLVEEDSYFFSKYASIWGWATWANRWNDVTFNMKRFDLFLKQNYKYSHMSKKEGDYQLSNEKRFYQKQKIYKPKTWDTQMGFTLASNMAIGIVPSANLTTNVGIEGVHSKKAVRHAHLLPAEENFEIVKHPDFIQTNWLYDEQYFKIFRKKKGFIGRVFNKLKQVLNKKSDPLRGKDELFLLVITFLCFALSFVDILHIF